MLDPVLHSFPLERSLKPSANGGLVLSLESQLLLAFIVCLALNIARQFLVDFFLPLIRDTIFFPSLNLIHDLKIETVIQEYMPFPSFLHESESVKTDQTRHFNMFLMCLEL